MCDDKNQRNASEIRFVPKNIKITLDAKIKNQILWNDKQIWYKIFRIKHRKGIQCLEIVFYNSILFGKCR